MILVRLPAPVPVPVPAPVLVLVRVQCLPEQLSRSPRRGYCSAWVLPVSSHTTDGGEDNNLRVNDNYLFLTFRHKLFLRNLSSGTTSVECTARIASCAGSWFPTRQYKSQRICAGMKAGEIAIADKAYAEFNHLFEIEERGIFWVTRATDNMNYEIISERNQSSDRILLDAKIRLAGVTTSMEYPQAFRLVRAIVEVNGTGAFVDLRPLQESLGDRTLL